MQSTSNNRLPGIHQEIDPTSVVSFVIAGQAKAESPTGRQRKLCFQSKVMKEFNEQATLYAKSSASVLITGESGTGKELFSRLIHDKSNRSENIFHAVNCAAIPEALLESELFGHKKGAFTGAQNDRAGHFEQAKGGSLLLDEISELPIEMQAKLLRVIEEQEVQPVGSTQIIPTDVRIIATANKNLDEEVAQGRFRHDLFHRLCVVELQIPPLRQRVSDIPLLVIHFVNLFKSESPQGVNNVTQDAVKLMCEYHWPGNVRELRNVIHRACIVSQDGVINESCLPSKIVNRDCKQSNSSSFEGMPLASVEKHLIIASLKKYGGSKKLAAAELGVTARTLSNKLKQYGEVV